MPTVQTPPGQSRLEKIFLRRRLSCGKLRRTFTSEGRPMSTSQPTRAPLQLEKLENEELLQHYCKTLEEMYVLALWERFMDRKNRKGLYWGLRGKARASGCPRGCN